MTPYEDFLGSMGSLTLGQNAVVSYLSVEWARGFSYGPRLHTFPA